MADGGLKLELDASIFSLARAIAPRPGDEVKLMAEFPRARIHQPVLPDGPQGRSGTQQIRPRHGGTAASSAAPAGSRLGALRAPAGKTAN